MDDKASPEWLRNLPTRSEEPGFSPDELRSCDECGRQSSPNRETCLYCGAVFPGATARLEIREVESWEKGFNLILERVTGDLDKVIQKIGSTIGNDATVVRLLLESGKAVPILRVESDVIAKDVAHSFAELGVQTRTVSDDQLGSSVPHMRLRGVAFHDDKLAMSLFNSDDTVTIDRDDLALLVTGVIHEGRTEAMEQRKRRSTKTLSETETSTDQSFIDIYSRHDSIGWRIPSSGFDFSCLGEEKSLMAGENLTRLAEKLALFAPSAKVVDDYLSIRPLLEYLWPSDHRRDALGFQRSGFARKDLARVMTTSNLTQANKYSRLQWHLL